MPARRTAVTALALLAVIWAATLVATPALAAGAAGSRGPALATLVHLGASRVCHQRADRSFRWQGQRFPVCGRCLALYLTGAAGLLGTAVVAWTRTAPRSVPPLWRGRLTAEATWLIAAAVPSAALAAVEYGLGDPGTWARALASAPLGLAAGAIAGLALAGPPRRTGLLH